jgi:hypothetical protein
MGLMVIVAIPDTFEYRGSIYKEILLNSMVHDYDLYEPANQLDGPIRIRIFQSVRFFTASI